MNVVVATLNAKYIHTCLALRYLKAYAAPEFDVHICEFTIKDPALNIATDLFNKQADVIGFSCYIWNIEETITVVNLLKKINPALTIVLGGPEVSYDVIDWLDRVKEADFIVIGEGEKPFKSLLSALKDNEHYHDIDGLAFRENGKNIIHPPKTKLDLNTIPSPFRFQEDLSDLSKRITYVETSRGCPFSCQFCLSSIETGVRYFDIERIKEDLLYLMENGAKTIKFVDRTFNLKKDYALEMFRFLIDHHRKGCVFQFEITADIMRPEVLEFLNKHAPKGLFRFEIGVQSTNDLTNKLVMRKQNFEKLAKTVTMIKEGGKIAQHLDLIAGLPEEDYVSFRKTFNDVFALRPEELQLGFLKMLRGTGLRLRADEHQYVYMDRAPYEVLSNNVLSFNEIVRIKQVEDVLEKYWNDHRMDHTMEYIIQHLFETPFDFFQAFGTFWNEQGWARIGHQPEDLFKRLHRFLKTIKTKDLPLIEGLMKYDYLMHQKHKPRKPWWNNPLQKSDRSAILDQLLKQPHLLGDSFQQLALSEKEFVKHTVFDVIPFDILHYVNNGELNQTESLLLVYYHPKSNEPQAFSAPIHKFKQSSATA